MDHQYSRAYNYKLDCDLRRDKRHLSHIFLGRDQCILYSHKIYHGHTLSSLYIQVGNLVDYQSNFLCTSKLDDLVLHGNRYLNRRAMACMDYRLV